MIRFPVNPVFTRIRSGSGLSAVRNVTGQSSGRQAIRRTGDELGVNIIDYCVYPNRDESPSHYEFLIEPDRPLDPSPEKCAEHLQILEKHLGEVNPVYKECVDTNEIAHAVLYVQQMQTHALWRDVKVHKGTSLNQVKPVRVLDTPMKKNFFYKLREE